MRTGTSTGELQHQYWELYVSHW